MNSINRRDFLKLIAAIPTGMALSKLTSLMDESIINSSTPNIIVIVMDALTARNMSLYGYERETTPNIARFAARSNVYHSHHSAGTFTTTGVASLLTGTYPWTHRAINLKGLVARDRYRRNIFNLLESHYNRVGFTQNYFANYLLSQFSESINQHLPIKSFSQLELYTADSGQKDHLAKFRTFDDFLFDLDERFAPGSLVLGLLNKYRAENIFQRHLSNNLQYYRKDLIFDVGRLFTGIASNTTSLEAPSFCYYHVLPPHAPYTPKKKHQSLFINDNWKPIEKPKHPLRSNFSVDELNAERLRYDQYIVTTDWAFGKFLDNIDAAGLLDKSYVILTSDHGESFERGYLAHAGPFVYEPCIHVPLLISSPGQTVRRDYYSVTNSVDMLSTFLNISGVDVPQWNEGRPLPGFGGDADSTRLTFSMDAKGSSAFGDLSPITIAMYQGDYKIIYYKGYGGATSPYNSLFELYNLKDDPEELQDLIADEKSVAQQMKELLLDAYQTANQPIQKT